MLTSPPPLKTILGPLLNVLLVKSALGADQEIFIGHSNSNYFAAYVTSGTKNFFLVLLKQLSRQEYQVITKASKRIQSNKFKSGI